MHYSTGAMLRLYVVAHFTRAAKCIAPIVRQLEKDVKGEC